MDDEPLSSGWVYSIVVIDQAKFVDLVSHFAVIIDSL
jgi:hypothetical protein